ncbi:MAG: acyl-CoA/acyl-ACP dehydrogenase [Gammaproteobacteria bacterium]|nr:acyl-CoA/acyl-ACP dehydrogenase [Gammaproteobacteria bacterium]
MIHGDLLPFNATEVQRELSAKMRDLGEGRFRARAREFDERNEFPYANYADLREAGFLGLTVPQRYGGLGADYATYALVAAELGRWCPPTALTFNMHACTMLWSSVLADDIEMSAQVREEHEVCRSGIYRTVVEDGAIYAQPASEPNSNAASGKSAFGTTARVAEGGYVVNGVKHFASLSGAADYYSIVCTEEPRDDGSTPGRMMLLAIPAKADGVEIFGNWDVVGMRPTDSRSLRFTEVFVPSRQCVLPPGAYMQLAVEWPHMFMTLTPTYVGLAQAVFDYTVAYLRGEMEGGPGGEARNSPVKQMAVAQMRIKLEQLKCLFFTAIAEAGPKPAKATRLRAYAAQYTVMEYANDIARLGLRTCGGRALFKHFDIERWYRDSRCGALMLPWTAELCIERLGYESLFERGER